MEHLTLKKVPQCRVARRSPGGRLPDEWLDYTSMNGYIILPPNGAAKDVTLHKAFASEGCGGLVALLPCKTFLDVVFDNRLSPSQRWHPLNLNKTLKERLVAHNANEKCREPLGEDMKVAAVVNLCLTERHYDGADLREQGIEYYWYKVDGGGTIPSVVEMARFCHLMQFLGARCFNGLVILHCTHGINRTGFLTCLFLMVAYGLSFDEAHGLFSKARGHSMNRVELMMYLKELSSRIGRNEDGIADIFRAALRSPFAKPVISGAISCPKGIPPVKPAVDGVVLFGPISRVLFAPEDLYLCLLVNGYVVSDMQLITGEHQNATMRGLSGDQKVTTTTILVPNTQPSALQTFWIAKIVVSDTPSFRKLLSTPLPSINGNLVKAYPFTELSALISKAIEMERKATHFMK